MIDVAHNPQAAEVLAAWLAAQPARDTVAVFGALVDKDAAGMLAPLAPYVAEWELVDLARETERGRDLASLAAALDAALGPAPRRGWADVAAALDMLLPRLQAGARVIAFGSFLIAAAALRWLPRDPAA